MKYKTVQINPSRNKWVVSFFEVDGDRVREKRIPNPIGFYHYPWYMSDKEAFDKLKKCMISSHKKEIVRLMKSVKKLEELEYGTTITRTNGLHKQSV